VCRWLARACPRIIVAMPDVPEPVVPPARPVGGGSLDHAVAETMRRVHEQLRRGAAPSFEALLAFGEPA
jgi:hypothetical protein